MKRPKKTRSQKSDQPIDVSTLPMTGLWNTAQTAAYLGVKPITVRTWRTTGTGPRFVNPNKGMVRYFPEDVKKWAEGKTRTSTSAQIGGK